MNAIIGFTELLREQVTDQRHKAYVKTIHSAGNTLLVLINDILDLSKIEAGKMSIVKAAVNPHQLLTEVGNMFMLNIHQKGLELILEIDPDIPDSLILDATRLRQVLFNLIGNAVKFTEQGHIRLKAKTTYTNNTHTQLNLHIEIEDSGIGIHENQLQAIFAEFSQSEDHNHLKYGGTGLGLSISRRLTQLMGGELSVSSQPDIGSTFTLGFKNVDVAAVSNSFLIGQQQFNANAVQFMPAVVMVVDDLAYNRELISEYLADTVLTVIEADNGIQATDKARQQSIDLILMDLRMPEMNGYQAAETIKSFLNIPIIALTASVMKDEHQQYKNEHFDGYLQKPLLRTNLVEMLSRFLDHKEYQQAIEKKPPIVFSNHDNKVLFEVLHQLGQQQQQWHLIQQTNNLADIQVFAKALRKIADDYKFNPLNSYVNLLNEKISVFDVQGIEHQLHEFKTFKALLKEHQH
jgi:two-component system sensor histidine kinase EvgS